MHIHARGRILGGGRGDVLGAEREEVEAVPQAGSAALGGMSSRWGWIRNGGHSPEEGSSEEKS